MSDQCFEMIKSLVRRPSSSLLVELSILMKDGCPISAIVFTRYKNRRYFLQSGFQYVRGLSPLLLHLGYEIEASFEDCEIMSIDLMPAAPGGGDYKARFGTSEYSVSTFQIGRSAGALLIDRLTWPFYN